MYVKESETVDILNGTRVIDAYIIASSDDTVPSGTLVLDCLPTNTVAAPGSVIQQPSTGKTWIADEDGFQEQ